MSREYKPIKAAIGEEITCKSWVSEGLMRSFMNMFNPEIATDPKNLSILGDSAKAVRSWETFDEIIEELKVLDADETLVVQSGKPVGIFQTHMMAPRVLITNSMVCEIDKKDKSFQRLVSDGLTLRSESTVGSWTYAGSQGLLSYYYMMYNQVAKLHFQGSLQGKLVLSTGLQQSQGFDALAGNIIGATILTSDADSRLVDRLISKGIVHHKFDQIDIAINKAFELKALKKPETVVYVGKAHDLVKAIVNKNLVPATVTDNSSIAKVYDFALKEEIKKHAEYMLKLQGRGAVVFDSGNGIRQVAEEAGLETAMMIPGCYELYMRELFCEGKGALQWTALSGDAEDIKRIDDMILEAYPDNIEVVSWIKNVQKLKFPGLPTRVCWLGHGERRYIASEINKLVRDQEVSAPVIISRESIDAGSISNPGCVTQNMNDKSDAIADWVFLNAMMNASSGASLVSIQQARNMCGNAINTGIALVANGSPETDKRISMVFANDQGLGIMRYADAGYEKAINAAQKYGLMSDKSQNGEKK